MSQLQRCSNPSWQSQPCRRLTAVHSSFTLIQRSHHVHEHGYGALCPSYKTAGVARQHGKARQIVQTVHALQIDRRHHLELAWKRQQEREERLAQVGAVSYLNRPPQLRCMTFMSCDSSCSTPSCMSQMMVLGQHSKLWTGLRCKCISSEHRFTGTSAASSGLTWRRE